MKKPFIVYISLLCAILLMSSCSSGLGIFDGSKNTVSDTAFIEPPYIDYTVNRLLYSNLDDLQQQAYRSIYNAVTTHKTRTAVPKLSEDSIKNVYFALTRDNSHIICLDDEFTLVNSGSVCYFVPHYLMDEDECLQKTGELIARAKSIAKEAEAYWSEYDTQLFYHDTLVKMCDYKTMSSSNAYCALITKESSCTGYALGLKLLLDISGIKSVAVKGVAADKHNSGAHLWLVVNIDGMWYHCDPTWDDPVGGTGEPEHSYFNVSTQSISVTHSDFTLPNGILCLSEDANYYIKNGLFCDQNNTSLIIYSALSRGKQELGYTINVRFSSNGLMHSTIAVLESGTLENWVQDLSSDYLGYNGFFCKSSVNEEMNILRMQIRIR